MSIRISRIIWIVIICTLIEGPESLGQSITINQDILGFTLFSCNSDTNIDSLSQLPPNIAKVVRGIINARVPKYFADKLTFIKGVHYDLKKYFRNQNIKKFYPCQSTDHQRVMPAYDLRFKYSDKEYGIKQYCVILSLDDYGQVLKLNLPNADKEFTTVYPNHFSSEDSLIQERKLQEYQLIHPSQARKTAEESAKKENLATDSCEVNLFYNSSQGSLSWEVRFVQRMSEHRTLYQCYEIDARTSSIVSTKKLRKTVYDD